MKQSILGIILSAVTCFGVSAQTAYLVSHLTGTQAIGGINVTVTPVNSPSSGTNCTGPYYIGANAINGYKYSFSPPVGAIRINNSIMHNGEIMGFYINGAHYAINSGNISASGVTCSGASATAIANTNGDLAVTGSGWANMQVNINPGGGIDSIRIQHLNGQGGGCLYNFYFIDDTSVTLNQPFNDTLLCAGDTVKIPYSVSRKFKSGNTFTAQLSNSSGSFASPTTIGTISSDTNGMFSWVVPSTITPGSGYRIRVVASNPVRVSNDNGKNIEIGNTAVAKPLANNNGPVCANDTLKLSASTTTSGVTWSWMGPGNFTSGQQNPQINSPLPANGGDYIVMARIFGCFAKDTTTVVVNTGNGPAGTTATTNAPICTDDTLKLFGTANGTGNNYSWTGPGSFSSNQQNPVLPLSTASMSGDYVLYAGNGNCISRDTVTVVIKPRPANFSGTSNSPVCTGETINFTGSTTSSGVTWAWTGPNGFNSNSATPFINGATSAQNGDYYVTGTLNGCALKDTVTVQVKPLPVKPVAGVNTPICASETLNFTAATSTSGVSWSWSGPNSFSSSNQNPSISNTTTSMSGDYIVTAILNGCNRKDTVTVLVKPLPAPVTTSNNGPVCAGDTLKVFSTASTGGAAYSWTGPNSFNAGTQNSFVTGATTAATGWYRLIVDLNGCTTKDSTNATVYPIPATPNVSYSNPMCVGETLQLNASTVPGATYTWGGVGGYNANTQNPTRSNMQFGDTGTYSVTASANGCISPAGSIKVNINSVPFVVIFPTPGDSICVGEQASFTALPNNHGGTPTYKWYVNGVLTGGNSTSYSSSTLNNGDVVRVDMTENTKCRVNYVDPSNDVEMKVLPWLAPSVMIVANPNRPLNVDEYVTFTATPVNGGNNPRFQWKRNGQDVQGATGSQWSANTLNDNDSISVELISGYRCPQPPTASSNGIRVKVLTGVGNIAQKHNLALYPNPNTGSFVLSGRLNTGKPVQLDIINALGQVVHSETITASTNELHKEIQLSNIANGIYLLRLNIDGEITGLRFRVER